MSIDIHVQNNRLDIFGGIPDIFSGLLWPAIIPQMAKTLSEVDHDGDDKINYQ